MQLSLILDEADQSSPHAPRADLRRRLCLRTARGACGVLFVGFVILGMKKLCFADDPAAQGLLKELEGTYKVALMEANGVATSAEFLDLIQKVVVKDGVMSFHEGKDGKAAPRTARLTVVSVLKGTTSQAQIDIAPIEEAKKDQKYPAIVKVTKDGIVFCWPEREDSARPGEFVSTQSNKQTLLTLKRTRE